MHGIGIVPWKGISILFSLFQSKEYRWHPRPPLKKFPYYLVYFKAWKRSSASSITIGFPYYLVYFKAFMLFHLSFFFMIISILFSLFQSSYIICIICIYLWIFPYYLVYFKAVASYSGWFFIHEFPYYLVYFKAHLKNMIEEIRGQISILFSLFQSEMISKGWDRKKTNFHTI